jgi:hypothetical protein
MKNAVAVIIIFFIGLLTGLGVTGRALEAQATIPAPIGAQTPAVPTPPPLPASTVSPVVTFSD